MRLYLTNHPNRFCSKISDKVTLESMITNEAEYYREATRLRKKYASQIHILIGFETDWIRTATGPSSSSSLSPSSSSSLQLITDSLNRHRFDFFVGSIHHTYTIPIDFDHEMYVQARNRANPPTDEKLFEAYFDEQLVMLEQLKPLVVGHFDLIRLKSDDPERSFQVWPGVWVRILRNLRFVAAYGGLLELNSAALRKGMSEPYPKAEICQVCPFFLF